MTADGPAPGAPERDIFPTLTAAQIERVARLGRERPVEGGEILFEPGTRNRPLMVVLEGEIEILSEGDAVVTVMRRGNFSGDVDLIAGHPAVVRARARLAGRILELPSERVRALVQTDAELSQIFLRAFLLRRTLLMKRNAGNIVLIGSRHSAGTLTLQELLTRNNQPYSYLDADRVAGVRMTLEGFGLGVDDVPVLVSSGKQVLSKPTIEEVAESLGLNRLSRDVVRDVVVVGAGPGGLAAAVYGASEGLDVLVVESTAPGGQAGSSSRIENYLGFPTGVSGQELASGALLQAQKFGAELVVAQTALALECDRGPYRVGFGPGVGVVARTVVIATGVMYRKPDIPDLFRFEGVGVYYGATPVDEIRCRGEDVIVVGGANSAGQAAIFLSEAKRRVYVLIRGPGLSDTMSRYLIRRIEETPTIGLKTHTRIVALEGADCLEGVTWSDADGRLTKAPIRHVFMMTGANPNTRWLEGCVALDEKGFVKAGPISCRPTSRRQGGLSAGRPSSSRRTGPASSPSATCGQEASSALPRQWGRAPSASSSFTRCWRSSLPLRSGRPPADTQSPWMAPGRAGTQVSATKETRPRERTRLERFSRSIRVSQRSNGRGEEWSG